jgi:hypothetical protein
MKRFLVLVGVAVPLLSLGGCSSNNATPGAGGQGGSGAGTGAAGTGGGTAAAGIGGTSDGGTDSGTTDGSVGGSGGAAPTLAQLCPAPAAGGAGGGSGPGGAAGSAVSLAFVNQTYLGDPRVVPSEAIFSYINTTDDPKTQTLRLHNGGTTSVQISGLQIVDNPMAPATAAPATPGPAGGTQFPLTYNQASLPAAFKITPSLAIPATLAAGADLDVVVQFLSTHTNPPDRMLNFGGQGATAVLVAQVPGGCVPAGLYAVSLWNNSESLDDPKTGLPTNNWARYEPTFGQIIATLGYKVNVGAFLIGLLNTNDMSIPGVGLSTEEVQVHKFVKADASAPVSLLAVGRFAPPTDLPFGWYTIGSLKGTPVTGGGGAAGGTGGSGGAVGGAAGGGGAAGVGAAGASGAAGAGGVTAPMVTVTDAQPAAIPTGSSQALTQPAPLKVVATMSSPFSPTSTTAVDWNTSNYSEQVLPPLKTGSVGTTFDPGASPFGIWCFTDQRSVGGVTSAGVPAPNVANGDYVYSEDALNIDAAHSHRLRVYPLKDRAGALVPHAYLLGWEEASNGDYQDFVFLLENASPAP